MSDLLKQSLKRSEGLSILIFPLGGGHCHPCPLSINPISASGVTCPRPWISFYLRETLVIGSEHHRQCRMVPRGQSPSLSHIYQDHSQDKGNFYRSQAKGPWVSLGWPGLWPSLQDEILRVWLLVGWPHPSRMSQEYRCHINWNQWVLFKMKHNGG